MSIRYCTKCGIEAHTEEELDLFINDKSSKYNKRNFCVSCRRKQYKKYDKINRKNKLTRRYGITDQDYLVILHSQNGVCKVCGGDNEGKTLVVDHCHDTNIVRGLLCHRCNTGLGMFKDNVLTLKSAIDYLQQNKEIR